MDGKGREAAVIGAGIGGLATAIALQAGGWRATVYERADGLSGAGTALGMWPVALAALDTLGLGAAVRKLGQRQEAAEFRRPDGSRLGTLNADRMGEIYLLSRPALLTLLLEQTQGTDSGRVLFCAEVPDPDQVAADLVVAADGTFSRARDALFGVPARFTGATAWRGWIDDLPTSTFTEVWGRGSKFGVTPQEGGRTNWYATVRAVEGARSPDGELAALRAHFGGWGGPVPAVLSRVHEDDVLRHDLYTVPPLPAFTRGRIALLGDAAHAMPPDLGRGACEALVDAVTLARCLREAETVAGGLRGYDRQRRPVTRRLARAASLTARLAYLRRGVWARDTALAATLRF
ncbi:MAG TPA: FAD-dependent monooxygenase [Streptosporangiaceae bacterium]